MNILIFHQFYTSSSEAGISRFNHFAKEWGEKEDAEVTVVSGTINYMTGEQVSGYAFTPFWPEQEEDDVKVIRCASTSFGLGYRKFFGRMLSYFSFMITAFFGGMFAADKPDVIIASSPPFFVGLVAWAVSVVRRAPLIFEVRDLWPDVAVELGFIENKFAVWLSEKAVNFLYWRSKAVVVNSPGLKHFISKKKGVDSDKISVVPNPVSFGLVKRYENDFVKEEMGWEDKFVVMYTGSHSAVYDFDTLLDVAKVMMESQPNILFVLMGDGRKKPKVQKRIQKEDIQNVMLLPAVSRTETAKILCGADVGIATLRDIYLLQFVYATKIFDYMAAGIPAVLAMRGVTKYLVCENARCGICVEPKSKESIKKAILDLYNDSDYRKELGERGYDYAQKFFSDERLAGEYFDVLVDVTNDKQPTTNDKQQTTNNKRPTTEN